MANGRQNPSVVNIAGQTLLSRRASTRQSENFFFAQAVLSGQSVKRSQQPVQFAFRRKEVLIDGLNLLIRQPLDFFDDLRCIHLSSLSTGAEYAKNVSSRCTGFGPMLLR